MFWVNEEVIEQWRNQQKTGRKGASNYYSDVAIATMGTIQSVFHLPGRQAEGFLESLFMLMGIELAVPDHSTQNSCKNRCIKLCKPCEFLTEVRENTQVHTSLTYSNDKSVFPNCHTCDGSIKTTANR
ncbi:hypothetical protein CEN41_22180 [Fischerella thermalis CCMEE 5330]|uniref:Transposase DDE domain-containing protein n=1 Tax=Fischerella thermalis CCMEE 5330 TaxID=2019670 RepID=A0A2N6LXH4_9CYAN|nr:hypothetical protein CEN41_22180 [Fischerella thermalis CCMEE 5330]